MCIVPRGLECFFGRILRASENVVDARIHGPIPLVLAQPLPIEPKSAPPNRVR